MQICEKWLWLELIGFDVTDADLGVGDFLERLGFYPTGISLLIQSPEFLHTHDANWRRKKFPAEYCSYGGHQSNGERSRQVWTGAKLRQLVDELHSHKITVFFSFFDFCVEQEWLKSHPEMFYIDKNGVRRNCVCAWKRLSDGTYYEDFFADQLSSVMHDYNFDGLHAGDGFAHPRLAIHDGDFSNDMIVQFITYSQIEIPLAVFNPARNSKAQTRRTAQWILRNQRMAWCKFYTQRITGFWSKMVQHIQAMNKCLIFNSAWTRDPFEAIYRYGIDYRALYHAGVTRFVVELAAPALELEHWGKQVPRPLYSRMASTLLFRAYVPEAKLVFLNGIRDFNEQYFILQHAPTLWEAEVISQYNLFYHAAGIPARCLDGVLACLADGLTAAEWTRINQGWNAGCGFNPEQVGGAVLVYSANRLYEQIDDYNNSRCWYDYRILAHLLYNGAPIYSIADIADIDRISQPLVVLNPEYFDAMEQKKLSEYQRSSVILIGRRGRELPFKLNMIAYDKNGMYCGVIMGNNKPDGMAVLPAMSNKNSSTIIDPSSWLDDLYVIRIAKNFLPTCAELIAQKAIAYGFSIIQGSAKMIVLKCKNTFQLILYNDLPHYDYAVIEACRDINKVNYVTGFPGCEIRREGRRFYVKLPPSGITITVVDVSS